MSQRLASWLHERGFDVVRPVDLGADPGDVALLDRARRERRILVTMDKDFGALVFGQGFEHAGLIRLPSVPGEGQARLMAAMLDRHDATDLVGAVVTVRGSRIRIARPRQDAAGAAEA